jgi:hypothetical protein
MHTPKNKKKVKLRKGRSKTSESLTCLAYWGVKQIILDCVYCMKEEKKK